MIWALLLVAAAGLVAFMIWPRRPERVGRLPFPSDEIVTTGPAAGTPEADDLELAAVVAQQQLDQAEYERMPGEGPHWS